jgi:outer membrane protein OmpA-like peptidoglycan-associated protein
VQLSSSAVQQRYAGLIALQPMRPRLFVVQFKPNSNQLTEESQPVLAEALAALAQTPAPELVVIGHTDRVGAVEANDRLSLVRAETVRDLLVNAGVTRGAVSVVGRGEREPAVPTDDEVAEARNRRVEIKLR